MPKNEFRGFTAVWFSHQGALVHSASVNLGALELYVNIAFTFLFSSNIVNCKR